MSPEQFIANLSNQDPHQRYQALKALVARPGALEDEACRRAVVRICDADKLAYNRLEAMNALRHCWPRPEVVAAFQARLSDAKYISEACIRLLGEIGDAPARELLCKSFKEATTMQTKLEVIQAFQGAEPAAIFDFLKRTGAHESNVDRIRATIITLLGEVKNPTLRGVFVKALSDRNARVRANAVEALSEICEGKELLKVLVHCLNDRNNRVRANALRGLIQLGVKQAEPLVHEMAHHHNPRYRSSAAWILGEVGHAIPQGRTWLDQLTRDDNHNVTYRAELAFQAMEEAQGRGAPPAMRISSAA